MSTQELVRLFTSPRQAATRGRLAERPPRAEVAGLDASRSRPAGADGAVEVDYSDATVFPHPPMWLVGADEAEGWPGLGADELYTGDVYVSSGGPPADVLPPLTYVHVGSRRVDGQVNAETLQVEELVRLLTRAREDRR